MEPANPSLTCEVCGARVATLRRGRCWICYVRWADSRPVGLGAACVLCGDRRRENLRLAEFQSSWIPMCHNCGTKAARLVPMPQTVETVRERLARDRRSRDRRQEADDERILHQERRVGERRRSDCDPRLEWLDAEELIVEVIEVVETGGEPPPEATRIAVQSEA